jgi:hypothetical protein
MDICMAEGYKPALRVKYCRAERHLHPGNGKIAENIVRILLQKSEAY